MFYRGEIKLAVSREPKGFVELNVVGFRCFFDAFELGFPIILPNCSCMVFGFHTWRVPKPSDSFVSNVVQLQ